MIKEILDFAWFFIFTDQKCNYVTRKSQSVFSIVCLKANSTTAGHAVLKKNLSPVFGALRSPVRTSGKISLLQGVRIEYHVTPTQSSFEALGFALPSEFHNERPTYSESGSQSP